VARVIRGRTTRARAPPAVGGAGLLWLVTSAIALTAGGRFFGHYFHLILAPLCSAGRARVLPAVDAGLVARAAAGGAVRAARAGLLRAGDVRRPLAAALDEREPRYDQVAVAHRRADHARRTHLRLGKLAAALRARAPADGRAVLVLQLHDGREPGTPTETGQRNADANQLPAAWDMLFADLDGRRPALFVDAAAAGWDGYGKYPLARYPRLRAYVRRTTVRSTCSGVVLYRRLR
jgi:hypothetical protein